MPITPCPVCGYDRPQPPCLHCEREARPEPLPRAPLRGSAALTAGLRALPVGLGILLRTRGAGLLLLPPVLLTGLVFGLLFAWLWNALGQLAEAVGSADTSSLEGWPGWVRQSLDWTLSTGALGWMAGFGQVVVFALATIALAWFCFSLVYELISGPFLDELHGRIETGWFGSDPRDSISRPNDIPASRCLILSLAWLLPAGVLALLLARSPAASAWLPLGLAGLALAAALLADRRYGPWLRWVLTTESRTLWVSARAAVLSGLLLLAFLWLHLIPVVGSALFFALGGFVTAIGLLDIPISRRRWTLSQELAFLRRHLGPITLFGGSAALLFVVPIIGPLTMVPTASVGGLWLICQLDSSEL